MDTPSPESKPCLDCGRTPQETRFRYTIVPSSPTPVRRGRCVPCQTVREREARRARGHTKGLVRLGILPDCHHPNADDAAWNLALRGLAVHKPEILILLGDFADGESISLHEPDEPGTRDFKDEVGEVMRALTQLDALGCKRKIYLEGNHEQRLGRYLARNAPALFR